MNKQEIIKQAQAKLPDVNEWERNEIIVPVQKPFELNINQNPLPTVTGYYEVRFLKYRCKYDKIIWRYIGLSNY